MCDVVAMEILKSDRRLDNAQLGNQLHDYSMLTHVRSRQSLAKRAELERKTHVRKQLGEKSRSNSRQFACLLTSLVHHDQT